MSNPGGRFCPYCGKPVAALDATFCEHCGRTLPGITAPDPNSANVTPQGTMGAFVMSGDRPVATVSPVTSAKVVVTTPAKSRGIAVLLEFFIPGAGAMYLERVGLGVAWLIGTVIGGVVAIVAYSAAVQSAVVAASQVVAADCSSPDGCSGVGETIAVGMAIVIGLSVAWLIVRCVLVSRYAPIYNSRLHQA